MLANLKECFGFNFRLPKCHYLKRKSFIRHSTNFSRLYVTYLGCGDEMRHMWTVPAHPPFHVWSPATGQSPFQTDSDLPPSPIPTTTTDTCPPIYSVVLTEIHLFYPPLLLRVKGPLWDSLHLLSGRAWIKAPTRTSAFMARLKFTSPGELVLTESWDSVSFFHFDSREAQSHLPQVGKSFLSPEFSSLSFASCSLS